MESIKEKTESSWRTGDTPTVLTDIFSPDTSVSTWNREYNEQIGLYFEKAFSSLGLGIVSVFSIETLKASLNDRLPDYEGKQAVIDDIYLLCDMMTCLFECDSVGMRLAPLSSAMCPSFHVDNIPVRLVNTYLGSGTEWLPIEALSSKPADDKANEFGTTNFGAYYEKSHIQQLNAFDVALLKGKAWPKHEEMAAVHRSCKVKEGEKRILLTLDPI